MTAQESIKYQVLSNPPSEAGIKGKHKNKSGFTLIELMVTIAIIAVLAAVCLVIYSTAQKSGRVSKRVQDMKALQTAIELFKSSKGAYPNLPVGGTIGTHVCITTLSGNNVLTPTFMPVIPADPANSAYCYQYTSNGTVGGATPDATEYKIRTHQTLNNNDMVSADFLQQTALIDPARDGTAGCTVETNGTVTGWALYSGAAACAYSLP